MAFRRALDQTITVERNTPSKDAMGGRTDSFAAIAAATNIAAKGYKGGAAGKSHQHIDVLFGRPDWKGDFVWVTDTDCTARPGDRVNHGGVYYAIHATFDYQNPYSGRLIYAMDCTLVRVGAGAT
ncbi:MAG TPA: hypothetical protein VD994_08495 [Prosthecobacter sp.]|nr:hypothetical protein [Prosthecobacter sp.]